MDYIKTLIIDSFNLLKPLMVGGSGIMAIELITFEYWIFAILKLGIGVATLLWTFEKWYDLRSKRKQISTNKNLE